MEVLGIPGSLEKLLQPIKDIAERRQIFPHSFEELQKHGDIGNYLIRLYRTYLQGLTEQPYNESAMQGTKAEYHLASTLKMGLYQIEGCLFNNPPIDLRDDKIKGVGLSSFPDHLLITRNCFLYLETKNWSKKYLNGHEYERKREIAQQVERTQIHLAHFLQERGIAARPEALIYDHQGTLGESIGKVKVIWRVGELVQKVKESSHQIPEYQKIVEELKRVVV